MAYQGIRPPTKKGQESGSNIGQIIGTGLGAIGGGFVGGPAGAITGAGLGSSLGGAVGQQVKPAQAPEQAQSLNPMERRQQQLEESPQMQLLMAQQALPELPPEIRAQAEEPLKMAMQRIQQMKV